MERLSWLCEHLLKTCKPTTKWRRCVQCRAQCPAWLTFAPASFTFTTTPSGPPASQLWSVSSARCNQGPYRGYLQRVTFLFCKNRLHVSCRANALTLISGWGTVLASPEPLPALRLRPSSACPRGTCAARPEYPDGTTDIHVTNALKPKRDKLRRGVTTVDMFLIYFRVLYFPIRQNFCCSNV